MEPGEWAAAFYIDRKIAYFEWVFWEQFTSWKIRKLRGSIQQNARGYWSIQVPGSGSAVIYANSTLTIEMDIDRPPEI